MIGRVVLGAIPAAFFGAVSVMPAADAGDSAADRICQGVRVKAPAPGPCLTNGGDVVGRAARASSRDLSRLGRLKAIGSGETLRTAVASSSVYCRTWRQWQRGLYYLNWEEVHTGRFCYNGRDVWVDGQHGGYHRCDQGFGILYDVQVKNCAENKIFVNTGPGYGVQNWDYFRVHVVWRGIPLYQSHHMHANVYPSGNVYFKF